MRLKMVEPDAQKIVAAEVLAIGQPRLDFDQNQKNPITFLIPKQLGRLKY